MPASNPSRVPERLCLAQLRRRSDGVRSQDRQLAEPGLAAPVDPRLHGGPAGTAYTAAIDAAQAELDVRGRADASDVTVFMSDGEAKDAPSWAPANYKSQPCRSAIGRANGLRARGTNVYAIGYDIPTTGSAPYCKAANPTTGSATTTREAPEIRAIDALPAIANARQFYNQPDPDPMNAVLLAIAADLAQGRSRLTRLPQRPPQPRAAASG